ncbi:MAG: hypothetical protein WD079_03135, partial [Phycisphaeraceae bacterium]
GHEMSEKSWTVGYARCFGVCWVGDAIDEVDFDGRPVLGDNLLILFNAHHEGIGFKLPGGRVADRAWDSPGLGRGLVVAGGVCVVCYDRGHYEHAE